MLRRSLLHAPQRLTRCIAGAQVAVLSLASPCGSGITARVQRAASCVNAASALQPNMLVQLLVALVCLAGVHALAWRP